jgi:hypothetical protein
LNSDIEKIIEDLAQDNRPSTPPSIAEEEEENLEVDIINPSRRQLMLKVEYEQYQYKRIFWIAGYPKSGTTWVQLFLETYLNQTPLYINNPYQYSQIDSQTRHYQAIANQAINTLQDSTLYLLRPAALINLLINADTDLVLKTHHANIGIDEGIPIIPSSLTKQALYLVRDPRDTVISLSQQLELDLDETITLLCDQNAHTTRGNTYHEGHFISDWSTHVHSWTHTTTYPIAIVRYEDLLTDPETHFTTVLEALGRPAEPTPLKFAIEQTALPHLQAQEHDHGYWQTAKGRFFDNGTIGHWKTILSPDQTHRIETAHKDVMQKLGYLK